MQSLKKILITVIAVFLFSSLVIAQQADEAAVKACLENYMSGDGNRMEKAFHPSATMKYIDAGTNEFKDVPIADFIARVKANTNKADRKIEIVSMNIEGNAANGKIRIETDKAILYDYMNMLKIGGEWKIVSKIFSRINK
ncbi:MAG TPA: nuclear transport factor 2 family protein [Chitinophagaceae bacterium]|nr:nuclear transport factor 2 family protein [Chitinophagaceae bacterium]